jgi:hypothetical protein
VLQQNFYADKQLRKKLDKRKTSCVYSEAACLHSGVLQKNRAAQTSTQELDRRQAICVHSESSGAKQEWYKKTTTDKQIRKKLDKHPTSCVNSEVHASTQERYKKTHTDIGDANRLRNAIQTPSNPPRNCQQEAR